MKRSRLIGFLIAILLGAAGGLILGWRYYPAPVTTTKLEDLRNDYKADYVLMVSEVYASNGSLRKAEKLLGLINPDNPLRVVQQGLLTAQELGYETWELQYMADLEVAIRNQPAQEVTP